MNLKQGKKKNCYLLNFSFLNFSFNVRQMLHPVTQGQKKFHIVSQDYVYHFCQRRNIGVYLSLRMCGNVKM